MRKPKAARERWYIAVDSPAQATVLFTVEGQPGHIYQVATTTPYLARRIVRAVNAYRKPKRRGNSK